MNGADIPGANGTSLTVSNVTPASEGTYTVVVTDQIGSVPSAPAFLYPLVTPRIADLEVCSTLVAAPPRQVFASLR